MILYLEGPQDRFVTGDARVRAVLEKARAVAGTDATALIEGETGTGKEVLARYMHAQSARRGGPFVVLNCGINPGQLWASEVFGHTQGAFTGSDGSREGVILKAQGGTLFVDEVARLTSEAQASLLRFMDSREVRKVGSDQAQRANVRVIVASNLPLMNLVGDGRFLPDLYYRMKVHHFELPPLRQRTGDIPLLAQYFLEHNQLEASAIEELLDANVMELFALHPWFGNVRELKNLCTRLSISHDRDAPIHVSVLQALLGTGFDRVVDRMLRPRGRMSRVHSIAEFLLTALRFRGDVDEVSTHLNMPRSTTYRYLAEVRSCEIGGLGTFRTSGSRAVVSAP